MKRKTPSWLALLLLVVLLGALLLAGCGSDQADEPQQPDTTIEALDQQPQQPQEAEKPETPAQQPADESEQVAQSPDQTGKDAKAEQEQAQGEPKQQQPTSKPSASPSKPSGQQQPSQTATKPASGQTSQANPAAGKPATPAATTQPTGDQVTVKAPATDANGNPKPVDPETATVGETAYTCTLSVSCATLLDKLDQLDPGKAELVPADGVILSTQQVTFYEGESVFNVLQRELKKHKIHLEFVNTPAYNSAYIEGINNLYEFDCGDLSGWLYKVNDWFPGYGSSRYQLQDGDVIQWMYTCDLGKDVGGYLNGVER